MWPSDQGLQNHGSPQLSTRHKSQIQISTPVDCHLLSDCCLPSVSLYKICNLFIISSPPMCDLIRTFNDEDSDSSGPWSLSRRMQLPLRPMLCFCFRPNSAIDVNTPGVSFGQSAPGTACLGDRPLPCCTVYPHSVQPVPLSTGGPARVYPVYLGPNACYPWIPTP